MPTEPTKAEDLERRAHLALDRLEQEVDKLGRISRALREVAGLNGSSGPETSEKPATSLDP